MIDARGQIRELLESIDHDGLKVKMSYPKSIGDVPLITFIQIVNTGTGMHSVVDNLGFQIDVWATMTDLGFNRDYESPDGDSYDASEYYRKTLRYSSKVDTRTNRLIS